MRRTQVNLEEEQYRWLEHEARRGESIAAVVRRVIDAARNRPSASASDPAIRYLLDAPVDRPTRGTTVATLDDDVYGT